MLIRDIMLTDAVTATTDVRLPELVRLLQRRGFRHVPIVDAGKLIGIVSDRDVKQSMASAALAADGKKREHLLGALTAGDIMTRRLVTIGPTAGVEEAARLMAMHRVSALPVTERDRLLGIVTETDILRLFVRALGVLEPSSRLEVIALDPASPLTEVVRAVEDTGARISSVMTLEAPSGEREVVLRLTTIDARPAVAALEARGFSVRPAGRGAPALTGL
jgi:acetoin utilization protein AcuB